MRNNLIEWPDVIIAICQLANGDYNIWPLDKIVAHLQQGLELPDKTIAITIDDAYLSVFTEARPRLKALNFPYTVFVATQPVDRGQQAVWQRIQYRGN